MKKLISIVLSLFLILSFSTSAFASKPVIQKQNGFNFETLKNSKEHQKIKITNSKIDEVEYLESTLENGKYIYLSTSKNGSIKIESNDSEIKMTNLDTKEVKYSKIKTTELSKEENTKL